MFRRSDRRARAAVAIVVAVAGWIGAARSAGADEVASFLERHGLTRLLAVHLEQQLATARDDERDDLYVRLAALYAELLEQVDDPAQRLLLEQRSRELLADAPAESADELRIALLRGSYRSAQAIAERHRLRLTTPEEVAQAERLLEEFIPEMNRLRERLATRAEQLERQVGRASGSAGSVLADDAGRARRLTSQATFLSAWALYYQSWLHRRRENARVAEQLFAELLDPDSAFPDPEEVSIDLRSSEAIARSILGMALCKSLTSSTSTALEWLDLLDHERTFEAVRSEVPAWRIAILLDRGEHRAVSTFVQQHLASESGEVPVAWLRMIAVGALEDGGRDAHAVELVRWAVTELAAREELEQVYDLASRFGIESLGSSGFALRYVDGVLAYHDARTAHGAEEPALEPALVAQYAEAVTRLQAALGEPDAGRFGNAAAACHRLIGWGLYFQAEFLGARDAFERAAALLPVEEAPESLWMAIICLDKVVEASGNEQLAGELSGLIATFLEAYPSSQHAPKLVLKRAVTANDLSPEIVAELMAVPPNSEVYGAARRRAAQILYGLFRESDGQLRSGYGNEYLTIAAALVAADEETLGGDDPLALQRYLVRSRRILEVALSEGVERLVAARNVLDALEELAAYEDLTELEDELDFRRVQHELLSGQVDEAGELAGRLWRRGSESIWARLAARAVFKSAHELWRASETEGQEPDKVALAHVVEHGRRVLEEFAGQSDALERPSVMTYHAVVGEASLLIWSRTEEAEMGRAALTIYEQLLEARPRNATFLRAAGRLLEHFDEPQRALDCWRTLVAGLAVGSDGWFEAKFHVIELLATIDVDRGRQVMDQHKQLHPGYGPEPWGSRLKRLDRRLPPGAPAEPPVEPPVEPAAGAASDRAGEGVP